MCSRKSTGRRYLRVIPTFWILGFLSVLVVSCENMRDNENGNGGDNESILVGTWILPCAYSSGMIDQGWRFRFDSNGHGFAQQVAWDDNMGWVSVEGPGQRIINWNYSGGILSIGGITPEERRYRLGEVQYEDSRALMPTVDPVFGGETFFVQCLQVLCNDVPGPQSFR